MPCVFIGNPVVVFSSAFLRLELFVVLFLLVLLQARDVFWSKSQAQAREDLRVRQVLASLNRLWKPDPATPMDLTKSLRFVPTVQNRPQKLRLLLLLLSFFFFFHI